MSKIHLSYCILIGVLVALLCLCLNKEQKVEVVRECVTDTLYLEKVDTLQIFKPIMIERRIIDTLYLPSNDKDTLYLPIEQKHYSRTYSYDAWVSGYKPQLDSIRVYNKVEYKTITNTITKEIEYNRWNLYTYMGFKHINDKFLPSIGLMTKSPKSSIYMIEIGLDNNKDLFFGVNVGYKLK